MTDKQLNSLLEAEIRDLKHQRDHALDTVQRLTNSLVAIRRHINSSEDSDTPLAWEIWDITDNALHPLKTM